MRNKLLCLSVCLILLLSVIIPKVKASSYTVARVENLCDGIVDYKAGMRGVSSAQEWVDTDLCENAGVTAEFYVIALSQQGNYDFSRYEKALLRYINSREIYSATTREKYALALIAAGSNNGYITRVANEAIGGQGLMSLVFGLHILNNGYQSELYSAEGLVNTILGYQLDDGGWAVIGSRGDSDVTAMTLQALAPYYHVYSDVEAAVDRALDMLSRMQQDSGAYIGMGVENCESTAQVLCALASLGIDANTDRRFIKNENTVLDGLMRYRNADGSFTHTGGGFNETATLEAFYALTAYLRGQYGQSPLYILDNRSPATVQPAQDDENKQNVPQGSGKKSSHQQSTDRGGEDQSPGEEYGGEQERRAEENIVYIDGQAYSEQTDSHGKKETAAKKATQAPTVLPTLPTADNKKSGAGVFQPTDTAGRIATSDEALTAQKGGYKPYAIGAVLAAAVIAVLVLYLLKKRNKKHYIALGVLAAAAVLFILLTNFESKESYQKVEEKTDAVGTVTLSVRCDTLKNEDLPYYAPKDYVILDETEFEINEGETVYQVLLEASKKYDFQIDNRGAANNAYIAGIQYIYEFDYGDLSGWMYRVNGRFPDVGCQSYTLHDGDRIEWLYTKNIGKDL